MLRTSTFILLLLLGAGCKPSNRRYTPAMVCKTNLKQIDGAKAAWAVEHHKTTNDTPTDSNLFGKNTYIVDKPMCPKGGNYTIGKVGDSPRCNIPKHSID